MGLLGPTFWSCLKLCSVKGRCFSNSCGSNPLKVLLCSGQGAQYVGMFNGKYLQNSGIASIMHMASEIAGYDILNLCTYGPKEELDKTVNCQLTILLSTLVAAEILRENEPCAVEMPDVIVGYSVGEISALALGQSLSYEEAFHLVKARAEAMQLASDQCTSGMTFLQGADLEQAQMLCDKAMRRHSGGLCQIAIESYKKGFAIGGTLDSLSHLEMLAKDQAYSVTRIPVSGAFHTSLMALAQERYKEALSQVSFRKPTAAVVSNVTGCIHEDAEQIPRLLLDQLVKPVKWRQAIERIASTQRKVQFYELGPGKQLKPMIGKINRRMLQHYVNVTI